MARSKVNFRALNAAFQENTNTASKGDGYAIIDEHFENTLAACNATAYDIDKAIDELNQPITVSMSEVNDLIDKVHAMADQGGAEENILNPVFMSILDGVMRSFKISSRLGLTPSQVLQQCEAFTYSDSSATCNTTDTLTEYAYEELDRKDFGKSRNLNPQDVRDQGRMDKYKDKHFKGNTKGKDEYNPDGDVYITKKDAFEKDGMTPDGKECHPDAAETDHVIPVKKLCDELSKNKALKNEDIKDIANCDENLAVTSHDTNRAKGCSSNSEFIEQRAADLTDAQKKALLEAEKKSQGALASKQNKQVVKNLVGDRDIQKRFAKDAGGAALGQVGGVFILHIIKPIYFEMRDSIRHGLAEGVGKSGFVEGLKERFVRVKDYILNSIPGQIAASALSFLRSFVSVLIEAIIGCLTGVFRMIWRLLKEGIKIVTGAVAILRDESKSFAEKGDAIMQLAAVSVAAVAGVYVDGAVKQFGIPEPWSMLLASIASAVVVSGILCILNKVDIFNVKRDVRRQRIREIFSEMNAKIEEESKENYAFAGYVALA